jgi:hypothetical protein
MVMLGYRFIVWFHTVVAVVYTVLFPFVFRARWNPKMLSKQGALGSVPYTVICTVKVPVTSCNHEEPMCISKVRK